MDHAYIDEHQIAERYLLGKLAPEEAARFEEHSMSCPECLDRLETAETLRLGLRTVVAHEVAVEAVKLGLLARLMRSRLAPLALMGLFLIAALPAGILWNRTNRLESELARTREELGRSVPPDSKLGVLRSQLDEQRRQAEVGQQERAQLAAELEKARSPRINVPVVPLSPERSGPGGEPSTRISLSPSVEWIVLALELDALEHPSYRATLVDRGGRVVWQGSGLRPDAQETLTIALPTSQLRSGDFTVRVEGIPAKGRAVPVSDFSFQIR